MKYDDIRLEIKSGDIVVVHGKTLFAKLTHFVQYLGGMKSHSSISHIAVAWWLEDRLYCVEMDGKHNVLRPLSQYTKKELQIDIYKCPVPLDNLKNNFTLATEDYIAYDYWMNIQIGLRLLFNIKSKNKDNTSLNCSLFVARWLQWSGWQTSKKFQKLPCPAEIAIELGTPAYSITY
jgi:hypothetical protein